MLQTRFLRDGRAPIPKNIGTSIAMRGNKARNTKPELALRKELVGQGLIGYRLHWNRVPGRPDIAYPKKKVAIFVNGCFWHRCPFCRPALPKSNREFWKRKFLANQIRDKKKVANLIDLGWTTLTFWECQIRDEPTKLASHIRKTLTIT